MILARGDIVLLEFPFAEGEASKLRPALVVQANADNGRLDTTVVAMITSRTLRAPVEPAQFLIDPESEEGRRSGLRSLSAVNCANLQTIGKDRIRRTIGSLPGTAMQQISACLKVALGLG
jgi:mRNA interferase MazF